MSYHEPSASEIQELVIFAEQLAFLLRDEQQQDGFWANSQQRPLLGYTCHALEALKMLGNGAFEQVVEKGYYWLLNLSYLETQESGIHPLHPSRFKTLARLHRFEETNLHEEFRELLRRIDGRGLLVRVLEDELLGSMVVMDCLLELESAGSLLNILDCKEYEEIRGRILSAVISALQRWRRATSLQPDAGSIDNLGEASYAVDILLRSGVVSTTEEIVHHVYTRMLDALQFENPQRLRQKDALYSAIQLNNHFADRPEAVRAVQRALSQLVSYYGQVANVDSLRKDGEINALVLRLLLTYQRGIVAQSLTGQLWEEVYQLRAERAQQQNTERARLFEQLIRSRVKIHIRRHDELTGGITEAKVFRVEYIIQDNLPAETPCKESGSIVVKMGDLWTLKQSVAQYQKLSPDIRRYFARHASEPMALEGSGGAAAMMVLEDLGEHFVTFRKVLNEHDKFRLSPDNRVQLERAIRTIADSLFDIYEQTGRRLDKAMGSSQMARLYYARLDRSLLDITSNKWSLPLKNLLSGFTLARENTDLIRFKPIAFYQKMLYLYADRLRPVMLMLMHGDCHSRNIMLDRDLRSMKFIDLDRIDYNGDYVIDLAMLMEDVALFPQFFIENHRLAVQPETVKIAFGSNPDEIAPESIRYSIKISETARLLQQRLLERTGAFAAAHGDEHFRERLWLGISLHLLRLVDKQKENLRLAAALYVEAVKLLDVLVDYLQGKRAFLPDIPIDSVDLLFERRPASDLQPYHEEILRFSPPAGCQIRYALRAKGKVIRYFCNEDARPFLILDGSGAVLRLLFACPPEKLQSAGFDAQPIDEGSLRSVLTFDAGDVRMRTSLRDILTIASS